jgi:hypothetical protein
MKTLKELMLEIDMLEADPFPGPAASPEQEQAEAAVAQFLPQFDTQHTLDEEITSLLSDADIHPGDWARPGSDTYQKYQAFIHALWKEIEFKRGRK